MIPRAIPFPEKKPGGSRARKHFDSFIAERLSRLEEARVNKRNGRASRFDLFRKSMEERRLARLQRTKLEVALDALGDLGAMAGDIGRVARHIEKIWQAPFESGPTEAKESFLEPKNLSEKTQAAIKDFEETRAICERRLPGPWSGAPQGRPGRRAKAIAIPLVKAIWPAKESHQARTASCANREGFLRRPWMPRGS